MHGPGPISLALERARSLAPLVSEEALAAERLGKLTDQVAAAMLKANLFSILVPEAAGGLGGTRVDLFEACEELASADGSAGWCLSVCNAVNYTAYRGLDEDGRAEVFGHGPVACWTALVPNAIWSAEPGGYRVSGKWTYGSGSSYSRWVVVTSSTKDEQGQVIYQAHVVSKDEVELIEGSWDTMGLRATSSVDYRIADAFVPARRVFHFSWDTGASSGPIPFLASTRLNLTGLTAFASGVAQRALRELLMAAPKTKRIAAPGTQADDGMLQFGIAELEGRMRAARSHFVGLLSRQEEMLAKGAGISPTFTGEVYQAAYILSRAARDMVTFAFDNSGTSVVYAGHPVQRCFRDIFTGLKHASFTPAILGGLGKARLGIETSPRPL
jgi:alkylation response protein AidB-like acyl-CoA dehydrogenase